MSDDTAVRDAAPTLVHVAPPPESSANAAASAGASPSPTESPRSSTAHDSQLGGRRRSSTQHRSFLFPASELLPSSATLSTQIAAQLSLAARRNSGAFYGSKVHPSTILTETELAQLTLEQQQQSQAPARHGSASGSVTSSVGRSPSTTLLSRATTALHRKRADMQPFPLRFRDASLDEIFCKHFNVYVLKKVRLAALIIAALNAALLVAQYASRPRTATASAVFASRAALLTLALAFYALSFLAAFARHFDQWLWAHYVAHGVVLLLPRLLFLAGVWRDRESDADGRDAAVFGSQRGVRVMLHVYMLLVFNASGMRFTAATLCALLHVLLKGFFVVVFCKDCAFSELESTAGLALVAFCMLSSYYSERYVRTEFVERLSVAEDRKRRDDLLETMLPVHIKESLKHKRTDELAQHYEEVSILFCYVSNFQALSRHASAIDLVKLINRIVFCFDKATDARGVYKVEAIAETYMCAAGVPYRDPYHCEKVADMALTMMRIRETEQWSFNGVEIQLQIGIHAGPVVAGVVGSKTYSYHLFGDTVNTSSRICSSSAPGRIQISDRVRQLLARSGSYLISERGAMNLKGKGLVRLHWLDGKRAPGASAAASLVGRPDLSCGFESAVEDAVRSEVTNYAPHHRSDDYLGYLSAIEMGRWTLRFQPKAARRRASVAVAPRLGPQGADLRDIEGTAAEMEAVFRHDHDRESTPQFLTGVKTLALMLVARVLVQIYNQRRGSAEGSAAYALHTGQLVVALATVYASRRWPAAFYRLKERSATLLAVLYVVLVNLQSLLHVDAQALLEENLLDAVIFGLALRLRFTNAVLVNASGFASYVALGVAARAHTAAATAAASWLELGEGVALSLAAVALVGHFGFKRELGLRHDFLLKCTLRLETQKCEDLLANMLPSPQYAEALMQQSTVVDELAEVTLLYSDMVGFTQLGSTLRPGELALLLNKIYSAFDRHLDAFGVYKMDTVGDAFIVVGGLPSHKSERNHAAAVAAFAIEMLHEIERFCAEARVALQMRIGLHTGKVVGGVVGIKKPRYLIWGHHTVVANLMESRGTPGRVQLSEDTYQHLRQCPEFHIEERVGRVQISESEAVRTFFLAKNHVSVKHKVIARYLHARPALNTLALAQLRSCLRLPENSPLSKQLDAARPALDRSRSFVDIIGKR
ncbi:hypothetical protein P43SY_008124 [Pythium insidiosum]|uniref:Guanylate cyclase domain-containing protein n=1 Tax=Pythium insidiosum TaxID=114742 RepID=A0AAD5M0I0_PYTIN|nr:hypothetical protein P43SY_008124 [Pythium insidiosum]